MRKVAALALMLIQMAVFYGQEMLRLLSEEEYEEAKICNQWLADDQHLPETFMESWKKDCEELMAIDGLPVWAKSMSFEGKAGIDIYDAVSDITFKLQKIDKQHIILVNSVKKVHAVDQNDWQWEIFTIDGDIKESLCRIAIKCYFRDSQLKMAVWSMNRWSDDRCKEISEEIAAMIAFVLE